MNKKKILLAMAISIIVIGGLFGLVWLTIEKTRTDKALELEAQRSAMEQYLVDKYDKQFVVEDPVRKASGVGVEGYLESEASPVGDETIFEVADTGERKTDNYLETVWQQQARPEVKDEVLNVFTGDDVWFTVNIYLSDDIEHEYSKKIDFYSAYPEVRSRGLTYGIHTRLSLGGFTEPEHVGKVYELVEFVKSKNVDNPMIRYVVNVDHENRMYACNISGDDLVKISNVGDVEGCFIKYRGLEGVNND